MSILEIFDNQLGRYRQQLEQIGFSEPESRQPCSSVYNEVSLFCRSKKEKLFNSSPVPVKCRLRELEWFIVVNAKIGDYIIRTEFARAYTIVSNYMSFVYFGDHTFRILAESNNNELASKKIGTFLRSDALRGFRHAIAHGHWAINDDGTGITYWPRGQGQPSFVDQNKLIFWYIAARSTAYAALHAVQAELTNLS